MFLLYTCNNQGNHISYEGPVLTMMLSVGEAFEEDVRCIAGGTVSLGTSENLSAKSWW